MVFSEILKFFSNNSKISKSKTSSPSNIYNVTSDEEIQQGKKYLQEKQNMTNVLEKNLQLIESFETMSQSKVNSKEKWNTGAPSNLTVQEQNERDLEELKTLETKFQKLLTDYSTTYKTYMEDVQKFIQDENTQYAGKVIKDINGNTYYVSNFGKAHPWVSGQTSNFSSCQMDPIQIGKSIENTGMPIGNVWNAPCGYEGKNVKVGTIDNLTTYIGCFQDNGKVVGLDKKIADGLALNECASKANSMGYKYAAYHGTECYGSNSYPNVGEQSSACPIDGDHHISQGVFNAIYEINKQAFDEMEHDEGKVGYVDNNGKIHIYPNNNIQNDTGTCPTLTEDIGTDVWNSFTSDPNNLGSNMTVNTLCALGTVDPAVKQKLTNLNKQLIQLSQQIYEKIQKTKQNNINVTNQIGIEKNYLDDQLARFKTMFKRMKKINNKKAILNIMEEDSKLLSTSSNYNYVMWSIVATILLLLTIRHVRK